MKIIVTGGCGFIGSHLVDKLVELGYSVSVIDNLSTGKIENLNKNAKFYNIDIRDRKIEKIFLSEKPEIIFHLAAQINLRKSTIEPILDTEINVVGSINVIENFLKLKNRKKFIFASTGGAIYGNTKILPTPETIEPFPLSPYGISKLTIEKYLYYLWQLKKLKFVALRYGNVYGPRQNPFAEAGVIAIFSMKMLRKEKCIIFGDGKQTRDFIYIDDVIRANISFMKKELTGIFNVGTEIETSVNEIFDLIKKNIDGKAEKIYKKEKEGEVKRSCLSIKKIKKYLGWKPEISLEEGIKKTIQSFNI